MISEQEKPTDFINVQVTAIPKASEIVGKTEYNTTFNPEKIVVRSKDTVINYQLVAPTPDDIQFQGMTVSPEHNHQLSNASVSTSGKLITLSDANTKKETLNLTIHFIDKSTAKFSVDPEVENDPDPDMP